MLKVYETPADEPVPPECRATVARIQSVLDGDASESLDADAHPIACPTCRERVRAARVLLSVLATPSEPVPVPADFADRVVKAMWAEKHVRTRRRSYVAVLATLAASLLLSAGLAWYFRSPHQTVVYMNEDVRPSPWVEVAPAPREKEPPAPAPEPRPIRFNEAVANTGQAIMDTPRPFTESVAVAPKVFEVLSNPFKMPAPPADPMATAFDPARKSLAELPDAARAGLEPVTGTAEKAFARFLRDVGSVKPNS